MKTNNRARATFSRRMVVILLTAVMALSFTACGNGETGKNAEVTTTQVTTTKVTGDAPTEIPQDVNPGQWHEDSSSVAETTTTTTTTTTATTTEPTTTTSSEAPKQEYYEYDVAGAKIKLRTHIEDYISQNAKGNWRIDLEGISNSLGFYYPYYNSDTPPEKRTEFEIALDNGKKLSVLLDDKNSDRQNYRKVVTTGYSIECSVEFARYDISDSSVKTYWIANGGNSAIYKINFQQIVIFTFLEENAKYNIAEDWMKSTGIPTTSGGPGYYYVNE